ncbi:MAG: hypothetical protein GC155_08660 [Alphaproteobacteria bacterium]|nr:hypothetical protein [Alphaproteobacteria bacterium]
MRDVSDQTERRSFLSRLGLGAAVIGAGLSAGLVAAPPADAQTRGFKPKRHKEDAWMDGLKGGHRIVIDSAAPASGGAALLYANNTFSANKSGYGLETDDLAVIVVLRHFSTPFAYTDAVWAKYGEALSGMINFKDPETKAAPVTNLYNSAAASRSLANMGITIQSLVDKKVQFAVCNSATHALAGGIAQKVKSDPETVYKDFVSNVVPNSHLVAAGVVAVNRAQEYGYTLLTAV